MRELLVRAGLLDQVEPGVWRRDWVVHSQAAGDGRQSLRYLAPYVFRVAIGDHRIISCDDGQVTFRYRRVGSNRPRTMTLDAPEFLRRFLQHVLPAGFRKVRLIAVHLWARFTLAATQPVATEPPTLRCAVCGGVMSFLGFAPAVAPAAFDTS